MTSAGQSANVGGPYSAHAAIADMPRRCPPISEQDGSAGTVGAGLTLRSFEDLPHYQPIPTGTRWIDALVRRTQSRRQTTQVPFRYAGCLFLADSLRVFFVISAKKIDLACSTTMPAASFLLTWRPLSGGMTEVAGGESAKLRRSSSSAMCVVGGMATAVSGGMACDVDGDAATGRSTRSIAWQ